MPARRHTARRVAAAAALCAAAAAIALLVVSQPPAVASVAVDLYTSGRFTMKKPEPAFLRTRGDDPGHLSYVVGALKIHPPQRLPVYLVGDSLVRECMTTPAAMASRLESASGVATSLYELGSSNQNFGESLAIVDNLPSGPGLVVVSVDHARFAFPPSTVSAQIRGDRLLMPSTTLWRFVLQTRGSAPRNSIGPGVRAYLADWRKLNAKALAAGKRPWHTYQMHRQGGVLSNAAKRERIERWLDNRGRPGAEFDTWKAFNGRLLERLVRRAQARGLMVVLMESSQDSAIIGSAWDRTTASYRAICDQVGTDCGTAFIDPNLTAGLVNADFHDLLHMVTSGQLKWMDALATLLTPTVQQLAGGASPTSQPLPVGQDLVQSSP